MIAPVFRAKATAGYVIGFIFRRVRPRRNRFCSPLLTLSRRRAAFAAARLCRRVGGARFKRGLVVLERRVFRIRVKLVFTRQITAFRAPGINRKGAAFLRMVPRLRRTTPTLRESCSSRIVDNLRRAYRRVGVRMGRKVLVLRFALQTPTFRTKNRRCRLDLRAG